MAITANFTTHQGIALTGAYIQVTKAYVKQFEGVWSTNSDDEREQAANFFKLIYDVEIYKDKATRDDEATEQSMRISNRHLQHFKTDYDITTSTNPVALAYADLKTNSQLSNIADVTE